MKAMLFAVHDRVVEAFKPPFVAQTQAEAARMFRTACQDEKTDLHLYPEDFSLYQVGWFNNSTAMVESCVPPIFVAPAKVDNSQE